MERLLIVCFMINLSIPNVVSAQSAPNALYPSLVGPVCNNAAYLGDNGTGPPGQVWETRFIYYCPQGARSIQLLFAGSYVAGLPPRERALTDPQVLNLSVETSVPLVWDPNSDYVVGDQVSGPVATNNHGGTYIALSPSHGSLPTAANTGRWRLTEARPMPITCNGVRPCRLNVTTDTTGQPVADAFLLTDPLDVNIPAGTLIAVRAWIGLNGTGVIADGPAQTARAGSYQVFGRAEPDLTMGGSRVPMGPAHNNGPIAILGKQNTPMPVPSVCIIGDSRAVGVSGLGVGWVSLLNGGSGFVADDVGRLVTNSDNGATPDNTIDSAVYVIQDVQGGTVTKVGVYSPGHYAPAVASSNQGMASIPPFGQQMVHQLYNSTGRGLVVGIPIGALSGAAGLYEDERTFADGFLQKGLSDAGIPFASLSRSGDRLATWVAPSGATRRLAAIKRIGCTSVVIELGINDVNAGATATLLESQYVNIAQLVLGLDTVRAVYLTTLLPETSSSDHWVTAASQTPFSTEVTRQAVNAWGRSVPAPFSGTFDAAASVEVNRGNVPTANGGLWITNGRPHFATPDKVHLSPGTTILAARAVSTSIKMLQ